MWSFGPLVCDLLFHMRVESLTAYESLLHIYNIFSMIIVENVFHSKNGARIPSHTHTLSLYTYIVICIYIYMYTMHVHVCMHTYIYIYTYTFSGVRLPAVGPRSLIEATAASWPTARDLP